MALETITRCNICKKESCDGREWRLLSTSNPEIPSEIPSFKVCTSKSYEKDGKRYYHYVMGHGCTKEIELEEI